MYNICITFETGDSFGSEIIEDECLEIPTTSLEDAKENLKRLQKHNLKWAEDRTYCDESYSVEILTDNGTRKIPCFWMGYFERLLSAKIIDEPEDLEFTV